MEFILDPACERADARVRAIGGASAEHLLSFVTRLSSQQYLAGYACIVAQHALAFGRRCQRHEVEVAALADVHVERFQRSRARRLSRRCETRRQERQALRSLLLFLREQGIFTTAASCMTDVDRVVADFAQHLQLSLAMVSATVDTYARVARQFLAWFSARAADCLPDLRPGDSIAFVRQESSTWHPRP